MPDLVGVLKNFDNELILDILELQMESKKKGLYIINFKLIQDILELQMKNKKVRILGDDLPF